MLCPTCAQDNPPQARFCLNCGTALHGARPRAAHLGGERKVVTALFADVVGSTALAEQMDAEDWTAIMNAAFDRLAPAIDRYDGTVARLLGDALLALFGAPVAHEDDPVRAVRAALDLLAAAQGYAAEVRQEHGVEFAIRVGINTGPVVVGEVGSDLKYEYTAMGDAVNLAARMQAAARPMSALISEHTYRFVAPMFDCLDLGPVEVRGKVEPVRLYEVQGVKAAPGRMRGVAGLDSPMVGRAAELAALLEVSTALHSGQGGAALIVGEPGLGKTRLIGEWQAAARTGAAGLRWATGHCLSYGQGLAHHLLLDLLRALLGVPAAASTQETRAALERMTAALGTGADEVAPYLGHLLALPLDETALARVQRLDPPALQAQYLVALGRLLRALAAVRPLALICDDIHWADPASTDLLVKLLPLTAEAPVLFCFVTRPDHEAPGWRLVTAAREEAGVPPTELTLAPLSAADSRQLVANLLEIDALPDPIRALILQKAEGNPFFVEEVIRMLIDRGALVPDGAGWVAGQDLATVEIPDTLQGLLLARIDRLPDEVKRTLRIASVIGRQFAVPVLEQVLLRESEA